MSSVVKGVIFDLDGTLLDSEELHFSLYREIAHCEGLALERGHYDAMYRGLSDREVIRGLIGDYRVEDVSRYVQLKQSRYSALLRKGCVRPVAGVVQYMESLKGKGYLVGIATSATRDEVRVSLNSLGVSRMVDAALVEADVARGKPAPDLFLRTSEALGLAPGNCLVYEDSIAGVRAAVAAGMQVLGVAKDGDSQLVKAGASRCIASFDDLAR